MSLPFVLLQSVNLWNKSSADAFSLARNPVCSSHAWSERLSRALNGIVNWCCPECKFSMYRVCIASL